MSKSSFGKLCKIYIQTAVIGLDNKYISYIGWSMFKYVNVQEQSTYLVHPEQRYVCV